MSGGALGVEIALDGTPAVGLVAFQDSDLSAQASERAGVELLVLKPKVPLIAELAGLRAGPGRCGQPGLQGRNPLLQRIDPIRGRRHARPRLELFEDRQNVP